MSLLPEYDWLRCPLRDGDSDSNCKMGKRVLIIIGHKKRLVFWAIRIGKE